MHDSTTSRMGVSLCVLILATFVTISVVNAQHAPTAKTNGPWVINLGEGLTVGGSTSSDPDGDITAFNWDFLNNGSTDITGAIASPTWANLNSYGVTGVGTYPIKLTVVDATMLSASATSPLTVYDNTPHAVASANTYSANIGQTINFSATGSYNGRPDITFAGYNWSFGDATIASGITPTHAYSQAGFYSVSLTVTDTNVPPKTDIATFNIAVVPEPTVALPICGMLALIMMRRRRRVESVSLSQRMRRTL